MADDVVDQVIAMERRFWAAGGDPEFYRRHFATEGRCVFGFGLLDKSATVASMEEATPWASVEMDQLQAQRLADDVVAVSYAATGRSGGTHYRAMVSSVYVRGAAGWQLALHHQTPAA